jgi:hypothetical protein
MKTERSGLAAAREMLGEMGESGPRLATFARGLALGALVGAAIAGTALLERRTRQVKGRDDRQAEEPARK